MQVPPPTTLDPEAQRHLRHLFDHSFDTGYDLTRILVLLVSVALVLFVVAVLCFVVAQWRRARRTGGSPSPAFLSASRQRGAAGPESDAGP
jgi:hypothetical protein